MKTLKIEKKKTKIKQRKVEQKENKEKWITGDIGDKKHYTSKLEKIFEQILSRKN